MEALLPPVRVLPRTAIESEITLVGDFRHLHACEFNLVEIEDQDSLAQNSL